MERINHFLKLQKVFRILLHILFSILILISLIFIPTFIITTFTPFYYFHISIYKLTMSGHNSNEIIMAYNYLIKYLLGLTDNFYLGVFAYSTAGMEHFYDVKMILEGLFAIGFISLFVLLLIICLVLYKKIKIKINFKYIWLFCGTTFITLLSIIGVAMLIDFDQTFTLFHKVFFPGKDNWFFDPATDQIINVLPEEFFRNCFIFILVFDFIIIFYFTIKYILKDRNERRNKNYQKIKK